MERRGGVLSTEALGQEMLPNSRIHFLERTACLSDYRIFSRSSWGWTKVLAWQCLLILGIEEFALLFLAPHFEYLPE